MINHGKWVFYQPKVLPKNAPANALFAKRESDNVDWYDYVNSGKFNPYTLKLTVAAREKDGPLIISAPTKDATMLFPANHLVVELNGDYPSSQTERIDKFAGRVFNLKTGKISEPPRLPEVESVLDKILARLNKLEQRK